MYFSRAQTSINRSIIECSCSTDRKCQSALRDSPARLQDNLFYLPTSQQTRKVVPPWTRGDSRGVLTTPSPSIPSSAGGEPIAHLSCASRYSLGCGCYSLCPMAHVGGCYPPLKLPPST